MFGFLVKNLDLDSCLYNLKVLLAFSQWKKSDEKSNRSFSTFNCSIIKSRTLIFWRKFSTGSIYPKTEKNVLKINKKFIFGLHTLHMNIPSTSQ
jgi:hypothetical protein